MGRLSVASCPNPCSAPAVCVRFSLPDVIPCSRLTLAVDWLTVVELTVVDFDVFLTVADLNVLLLVVNLCVLLMAVDLGVLFVVVNVGVLLVLVNLGVLVVADLVVLVVEAVEVETVLCVCMTVDL